MDSTSIFLTIFLTRTYRESQQDPIKSITFGNSNPVCHAFDSKAKDGHDLLIGLNSGDVYSVSLRLQLQDDGKKLVGAHHSNKDGTLNNIRCMSISWIPECEGAFVAAHANGNLYSKDGPGDSTFPVIKYQTQFSVAHACSSKEISNDVIGENLKLKTELERKNEAEKEIHCGGSSVQTILIFFRRDYLCEQVNSLEEKLETAYTIADENEAIAVEAR
ncbi:hypothetical protein L2E82_00456 [Cichorium intybus]|uniref:Uncharacterized protein n=1 Tax=Cichorium intybus TaxID=13427 RepID=A0ACB9GWQ4_CICIN|nr:hypothetical protein L2E82_00456 [Cichorium intybus]